ncbi:MAG TPA: hypothetical protein PLG34_13905 [Spirochaetota bacterium]|nr:hypothetical protein [Spirochaetota bacterium]
MSEKEMKAQEEKWQAEDDARTLARAIEIIGDSKRLKKAQEASNNQLEDMNKTVEALNKVSNMKMNDIIRGKSK